LAGSQPSPTVDGNGDDDDACSATLKPPFFGQTQPHPWKCSCGGPGAPAFYLVKHWHNFLDTFSVCASTSGLPGSSHFSRFSDGGFPTAKCFFSCFFFW